MCLAVPGRILDIRGEDPAFRTGRVSFAGVVREVSLAYIPEAAVDDHVLVHAGFALKTIDEGEAARLFRTLEELGALEELEGGDRVEGPTGTGGPFSAEEPTR